MCNIHFSSKTIKLLWCYTFLNFVKDFKIEVEDLQYFTKWVFVGVVSVKWMGIATKFIFVNLWGK